MTDPDPGRIREIMKPERDYELECRLLVRFCGWRWMRDRNRGLCMLRPPLEGSDWEPSPDYVGDENVHLELLLNTPTPDERFHDWRTGGACRYPNGRNWPVCESGHPGISVSIDACDVLVEALVELGYMVTTEIDQNYPKPNDGSWPGGISVSMRISLGREVVVLQSMDVDGYSASALALAICRAADAIGGK
jgi:hypothetical protein